MEKSILITIILLTLCTATLSQSVDSAKFQSLEPYNFQLQYLSEDSALLIDVREFFEYRKSRIKGALFLPSSEGFEIAADTLDKRLSLFCYCYSGGRSTKALLFFYDQGFRKLYNLQGGITAWKKDGFPVDKKKIRRKK
jgi:phage shock protein E